MRRVLIALAVASWLAVLPTAIANAQTSLPPDNSGVDQYTENVPGAGGDEPSSQIGSGGGAGSNGGGGGGGSRLPPRVAHEFGHAGSDGAAAASLAEATAPDGADAAGVDSARGGNRSRASSGGGVGGIVGTGVGAASTGSYGMGIALPIILAATLVAALGFLLSRRRHPGQPGSV